MARDVAAHGEMTARGRTAMPGGVGAVHVVVVMHSKGVVLACNEAAALVRSGGAIYIEVEAYK